MITVEYLRSFRIYHLAIFDLVVSYAGVFLLSPLLIRLFEKIHIHTSRAQWLWLTLPLSILIHLMVGQETALTKMMLDGDNYYLMKALVMGMVLMAYKIRPNKGEREAVN